MSYKKITFNQFIKIIEKTYDPNRPNSDNFKPFTWLVGAGMSVSAGIPLANGVIDRIIVFEHLRIIEKERPWDTENPDSIVHSSKDFRDFFVWWNSQEKETIDAYKEKANSSFFEIYSSLKKYDKNSPEFYQKLFPEVLDKTKETLFISALISVSKGVNLATLGLAGITRDYPKWGQTILTTNFDDLLLQAILRLDHNARVLNEGDLKKKLLDLNPRYPQIIHLHGAHTDVRTKNSEADIQSYSKKAYNYLNLLLRNTDLIVLGYSGWQDLAMDVLKKVGTKKSSKGRIFWVPYQSDDIGLDNNVRDFFNSLPENRAYVIDNSGTADNLLDADAFILSLCKFLNEKNGGIASYRNEFLQTTARQHESVFSQLDHYPEFNPKRGLSIIKNAYAKFNDGDFTEARKLRKETEALIRKDLPGILKAEIYQEIGIFDLIDKKNEDALKLLLNALKEWNSLIKISPDRAYKGLFEVHLALAECYFQIANLKEAREHIIQAKILIRKSLIAEPYKTSKVSLLFALVALYEGHGTTVKQNLADFALESRNLIKTEHPQLFAHFHFISGMYEYHVNSHISVAISNFQDALKLYESCNLKIEIANCKKYLAEIEMRNCEFEEAEENLKKCLQIFEDNKDNIGKANIINALGDLSFQKATIEEQSFLKEATSEALTLYNTSIDLYEKSKNNYNLTNAITDLLVLYESILQKVDWGDEDMSEDTYTEFKNRLHNLLLEVKNPYAESKYGINTNSQMNGSNDNSENEEE